MDGGGFEPPKQFAADLQSVPFGHSGIHPYKAHKPWQHEIVAYPCINCKCIQSLISFLILFLLLFTPYVSSLWKMTKFIFLFCGKKENHRESMLTISQWFSFFRSLSTFMCFLCRYSMLPDTILLFFSCVFLQLSTVKLPIGKLPPIRYLQGFLVYFL